MATNVGTEENELSQEVGCKNRSLNTGISIEVFKDLFLPAVKIQKIHEFDPGMYVYDLAVTNSGDIIVANGKQVKRFLPDGKLKWETELPVSHVTIHNGYLYCTSNENGTMYKLTLDGKKIESKQLPFRDPRGIAFSSQGAVYIASGHENKVYIKENETETFSIFYDGSAETQARLALKPKCPLYVTVNHGDDSVLFTCRDGGHVDKFDKEGCFVWRRIVSDWWSEPCGVVTDSRGNVYIAAYTQDAVYHISSDLKYVRKIGSETDGLDHPRAIAYWQDKKQLIVGQKNKILVFQI